MSRQPSARFALVTLAALALGATAGYFLRAPAANPPRSVTALVGHLDGTGLYVIPANISGALEDGVYLTESPQDADAVRSLPLIAERAARWQGVAFCCPQGVGTSVEDEPGQWGKSRVEVGRLVLYGDPAVLGRVLKALR